MQKYFKYLPLVSLFFLALGVLLFCVCDIFEVQLFGLNGNVKALQIIFDSDRYLEGCPNISALLCFIFMMIGLISLLIYVILYYKNKGSQKLKDVLFWLAAGSLFIGGFVGFFAKADYIAHTAKDNQSILKALVDITAGYIISCVCLLVSSLILVGIFLINKFYKQPSENKSE